MKNVVLFFPIPWPGKGMSGRIPFSLLHLYSYLKGEDFKIRVVDERVVPDLKALINNGLGDNALCFGISSFTGTQIHNGLNIAAQLKDKYPNIPVVWGGWHPSCMPEQTVQHPLVDIVVRGQGEETFKELLYALSDRKALTNIQGISFKDNGKVIHNPDRELLPVLENLRLSYDILDVDKYIYKQPWGDRAIGIITSLGCPYNCGFCAVASVYKRRTIFRNMEYVLEELDYLVDRYKINAITLDDDNFFVSQKQVREFCEGLINKKYRLNWAAGAHVGLLMRHYDDEMLRLIKESGCAQLYIGAESGSDEVLSKIDKKATVAQTYDYVKKMKVVGIKSFLSTMVCFPGVSSDDVYDTMSMILKCRDIDPSVGYRLFYYTPYPGTPLYKAALDMGMKEPESLEEWSHHTLRKFKAPWIKKSYRKLVRCFYFYYFPCSGEIEQDEPGIGELEKILKRIYRLIFANSLLRRLARWRVKNSYFKFPIDAYFVLQGQHLRGLYNRIFKKSVGMFYDYED